MGRNVCAICALCQRERPCDSHCCDFLFIPAQGDWHLHSGGAACSESHGSVSDSRHKRFWQDMTPARICLWWRAHREGTSGRWFVTEKFKAVGDSVKILEESDWTLPYSVRSVFRCTVLCNMQYSCPRASAKIGPLTKKEEKKKRQWQLKRSQLLISAKSNGAGQHSGF